MVAALVSQTGLPVDKARELLQAKGWNLAQALAELKEQERRETSVLRFLQDFPEVDFDQARTLLMQYGWNYDYAV